MLQPDAGLVEREALAGPGGEAAAAAEEVALVRRGERVHRGPGDGIRLPRHVGQRVHLLDQSALHRVDLLQVGGVRREVVGDGAIDQVEQHEVVVLLRQICARSKAAAYQT